jgi:hypothetical protein
MISDGIESHILARRLMAFFSVIFGLSVGWFEEPADKEAAIASF